MQKIAQSDTINKTESVKILRVIIHEHGGKFHDFTINFIDDSSVSNHFVVYSRIKGEFNF